LSFPCALVEGRGFFFFFFSSIFDQVAPHSVFFVPEDLHHLHKALLRVIISILSVSVGRLSSAHVSTTPDFFPHGGPCGGESWERALVLSTWRWQSSKFFLRVTEEVCPPPILSDKIELFPPSLFFFNATALFEFFLWCFVFHAVKDTRF